MIFCWIYLFYFYVISVSRTQGIILCLCGEISSDRVHLWCQDSALSRLNENTLLVVLYLWPTPALFNLTQIVLFVNAYSFGTCRYFSHFCLYISFFIGLLILLYYNWLSIPFFFLAFFMHRNWALYFVLISICLWISKKSF